MSTGLCSVCYLKNVCKKNQNDVSKCNHRHIFKKMLHDLSMSLDETDDQQLNDEEINILDELLAE